MHITRRVNAPIPGLFVVGITSHDSLHAGAWCGTGLLNRALQSMTAGTSAHRRETPSGPRQHIVGT